MKILFLNSFYSPDRPGGAERTVENIAKGMAARGHESAVFTTKERGSLSCDEVDSVKVFRIGSQNFYWDHRKTNPSKCQRIIYHVRDVYNANIKSALQQVLKQFEPDVISCHNLGGLSISVWRAAFEADIPFVQVLHDMYLLCPAGATFKNGKACNTQCASCALLRQPHIFASRSAAALVGVSKYSIKRVTNAGLFKGRPHLVVYNGRDFPTYQVRESDPDQLVFGYIGAVTPQKGLDWLIREFQEIGGDARLLIAGAGPRKYIEELKIASKGLKVNFLGFVDANEFFKEIDVLVVPSLWPDTLPGVAIEACAHHVPVIASAIGGLPEIIKHGVNGLLCNPGTAGSLRTNMKLLLEDPQFRVNLARNCRGSIGQFASYSAMLDQHERIFLDAVAGKLLR